MTIFGLAPAFIQLVLGGLASLSAPAISAQICVVDPIHSGGYVRLVSIHRFMRT